MQAGYADVAKAYILYRKQREKVRNTSNHASGLQEARQRLREDRRLAREGKLHRHLFGRRADFSNSGAITANYWLSEVYDEEVANAHRNADMHIHDLSMLTGYCAGWCLKAADHGRPGRHPRQDHLVARKPPVHAMQPDGQLPGHHAKRVGRRAGLFLLRHLPRPFVKVDNLDL